MPTNGNNHQPDAATVRRAGALFAPRSPRLQPPDGQSARRIVALKFQKRRKATLCGFADFELAMGLRLLDCAVHSWGEKHSVLLPGRPTLDKDYQLRKDPNGRIIYAPLASVHPETLSFWNHWANSDFWGEGPGGFG